MMKVDTLQDAWNAACKEFPTDFELDTLATKNAGYNVYRSTAEGHYYDYICELGDRLELNLSDGTTINIWIDKYEDFEDEHNVKQSEYENLLHAGGTRELTYGEALDAVCNEFGFDPAKVKIITEVPKLMINSKRQLKKVGTISRKPIWNATDWNYIRFDCANWFYEMKNGELRQFYC